jgi:hypothetical protein
MTMNMGALVPVLFVLVFYGGIIAFAFYFLVLMSRIVSTQERIARAMEEAARKLPADPKP